MNACAAGVFAATALVGAAFGQVTLVSQTRTVSADSAPGFGFWSGSHSYVDPFWNAQHSASQVVGPLGDRSDVSPSGREFRDLVGVLLRRRAGHGVHAQRHGPLRRGPARPGGWRRCRSADRAGRQHLRSRHGVVVFGKLQPRGRADRRDVPAGDHRVRERGCHAVPLVDGFGQQHRLARAVPRSGFSGLARPAGVGGSAAPSLKRRCRRHGQPAKNRSMKTTKSLLLNSSSMPGNPPCTPMSARGSNAKKRSMKTMKSLLSAWLS